MTLQKEDDADRERAAHEFARGWLHTEVGRQVRPVMRVRRRLRERIRRLFRGAPGSRRAGPG